MLGEFIRILTYNPNKRSDRGIPKKRQAGIFLREEDRITSIYPSGDLKLSLTTLHNMRGER
jgi:hypothetical protein